MSKLNQRQRILKYIQDFGSITPMEAFSDLGITKLSTRVSELIRFDGIAIKKTVEYGVNRYGERTHYTRYCREVDDDIGLSSRVHKTSPKVA